MHLPWTQRTRNKMKYSNIDEIESNEIKKVLPDSGKGCLRSRSCCFGSADRSNQQRTAKYRKKNATNTKNWK